MYWILLFFILPNIYLNEAAPINHEQTQFFESKNLTTLQEDAIRSAEFVVDLINSHKDKEVDDSILKSQKLFPNNADEQSATTSNVMIIIKVADMRENISDLNGPNKETSITSDTVDHTQLQDFQAANKENFKTNFEQTTELNTVSSTTPETTSAFPTESNIDQKHEEISTLKTPSLKQVVAAFIDDVLEFGDKLSLMAGKLEGETVSSEEMNTESSQTDKEFKTNIYRTEDPTQTLKEKVSGNFQENTDQYTTKSDMEVKFDKDVQASSEATTEITLENMTTQSAKRAESDTELNTNNTNNEENSNQTQSFEEEVTESFLEKLDQQTTFRPTKSDIEDEFVKDIQTTSETSAALLENVATQSPTAAETASDKTVKPNMDSSLPNQDEERVTETMLENFTTTDSSVKTFNASSSLKEPIDALANVLKALGQSLEETLIEVKNISSNVNFKLQDNQNSEIEPQLNAIATQKAPSFKQAIDSFIEDIVEIGDKLELTEQSSTNESVLATTAESIPESQTDSSTVLMESLNSKEGDLQTTIAPEGYLQKDGNRTAINIKSVSSTEQNLSDEHFPETTESNISPATPKTNLEQTLFSENVSETSTDLQTTTDTEKEKTEPEETTLTPFILETFNTISQNPTGRSLELFKQNAANRFEESKPEMISPTSNTAERSHEIILEKMGTTEQSTIYPEQEISTTSGLASLNEKEFEDSKELQEITQVLDTTVIPEISTISMPATSKGTEEMVSKNENFKISNSTTMPEEDKISIQGEQLDTDSKLEVPDHNSDNPTEQINEQKLNQTEINLPLPKEVNQEETLTTTEGSELGSIFDSSQIIYKRDENTHLNIKTHETEQLQPQFESKEAYNQDEFSMLNTLREVLTKMIDESKKYRASSNLSYPTTLETTNETSTDSSIQISHVKKINNFEESQRMLIETDEPINSSGAKIEITTPSPELDVTVETQNYEYAPRTIVMTLEETTPQQQKSQKFTALDADKESEITAASTTENSADSTHFTTTEFVANANNSPTEELHRNGIIRQNFIDKFADYYVTNSNDATSSMEKELLQTQESSSDFEANTKANIAFLTTTSFEEKFSADFKENNSKETSTIMEVVTQHSDTSPDGSTQKESTNESGQASAEYTAETTLQPILAREFRNDLNSFSLNVTAQPVTVVSTQDATTQIADDQQSYPQLSSTTKNIQTEDETTTFANPENSNKEMVTFTQITETTTKTTQPVDDKNLDIFATTQTQETQTHSIAKAEEQQEIESTTVHFAQIESTDANEQIATTTNQEDAQTKQQTTETEIDSTTAMKENETTVTPAETEARSLSLPPPKLEYLQSTDGVEVFYGYSIVKHN